MIIVNEENIDYAIELLDGYEDPDFENLLNDVAEKQPVVLAYSMSMADQIEDEEYQQLLTYLMFVVWIAYNQQTKRIPTITESKLEQVEADHLKWLEGLPETEDELMEASLQENMKQPYLYTFISEEVFEDEEMDDETRSWIITTLNVVIRSFDDALEITSHFLS